MNNHKAKFGFILLYNCYTNCLYGLLVSFCLFWSSSAQASDISIPKYIWLSPTEISVLPMSGKAWERLKQEANKPLSQPNLSDQNDQANVQVLAKALYFSRTGEQYYRQAVINACMLAINSENDGTTLAFGRELLAYVISAQLVKLPKPEEEKFTLWLQDSLGKNLKGRTLRSTHQDRPNNWGTHAGASRAAVAIYLNDKSELMQTANIFRGWLGETNYYNKFKYRSLEWQVNPEKPVGVNPKGASKNGHNIDGVLPEEQRRSGDFIWPVKKEGYVYEALQGALALAVILHRSGYDVWSWSDKALLRSFNWLHQQAKFPAEGDDTWQPYLINHFYGTSFPVKLPANPGKNIGWTDWSHPSLQTSSKKISAKKG